MTTVVAATVTVHASPVMVSTVTLVVNGAVGVQGGSGSGSVAVVRTCCGSVVVVVVVGTAVVGTVVVSANSEVDVVEGCCVWAGTRLR